jgi:hypothetical protein
MPFSVVIDNAAQTRLTAAIVVLHGEVLALFSNAYRTQCHVYLEPEAWAKAAAKDGMGTDRRRIPSLGFHGPLPSAGEHVAGAGAGGAAVRSPIRYIGGPMGDEHDRLAIRAIIEAAHPVHLMRTQIANEAGVFRSRTAFKRKFKKYEGKVGLGWLEVHRGDSGTHARQPRFPKQTIRAGLIALPTTTSSTPPRVQPAAVLYFLSSKHVWVYARVGCSLPRRLMQAFS